MAKSHSRRGRERGREREEERQREPLERQCTVRPIRECIVRGRERESAQKKEKERDREGGPRQIDNENVLLQ